MSVPRFYLPPTVGPTAPPSLTGREAHHASRVLRVRRGDAVTVLDGQGRVVDCVVASCHCDRVDLEVRKERFVPPGSCPITLLPALTKTKAFEWTLQKATELGTRRLLPVLTARTVPEIGASKREKWHWITVEALKQSGSAWLPELAEPRSLTEILAGGGARAELSLAAALCPEAQHPRSCFDQFAQEHKRLPANISVWIGPEGDFTSEEMAALRETGVVPISLGTQILRAETAALYGLAVVHSELGWRSSRL